MFTNGQVVSLTDILTSKDVRSARQTQLQATYPEQVICAVKLNIPGNIKTNAAIVNIFVDGWHNILAALNQAGYQVQHTVEYPELATGPEGFIIVDGSLAAVKKVMIELETHLPLGRLFDIDVMAHGNATQLSRQALGFPARQCLVCDQDAKVCAKTQAHTYPEILAVIEQHYHQYFNDRHWDQSHAVNFAQKGLLYEVSLNPKPGLVDPASTGAHHDMDVFTFIDSSLALTPYFNAAYQTGFDFREDDLTQLFTQLRQHGIAAENAMFTATNGVNTHKGAIFSLGILLGATGYCYHQQLTTLTHLQATIKAMLATLITTDFQSLATKTTLTAGEAQFLKYQVTGIRGEAAAGYPTVFDLALPQLQKTTGTLSQRLLDTLMYLAGNTEDSNLIKRAGQLDILTEMHAWTNQYFNLGGSKTADGIAFLHRLDDQFKERNLSLGGSADLLILTIYTGLLTATI